MNTNHQKKGKQFLKNNTHTSLPLRTSSKLTQPKTSNDTGIEDRMLKSMLTHQNGGKHINKSLIHTTQTNIEEPTIKILISGRIYNNDCSKGIANTVIDVWDCLTGNGSENYQDKKHISKTITNGEGFYMFETTVKPIYKRVNTLELTPINLKITPPNGEQFVAQLYLTEDRLKDGEHVVSENNEIHDAPKILIQLTKNEQNNLEGTWDVVLADEALSVNDLYKDKGMIYSISPYPFSEKLTIKYGVFYHSKVTLTVYNIAGKEIAKLEDSSLSPNKYEAIWKPNDGLSNGFYFITIKINDLQVHYIKTFRNKIL